jgi:hypothetical protein
VIARKYGYSQKTSIFAERNQSKFTIPKESFVFGENPMVYFDGDSSVFDSGGLSGNNYRVYTIDYQLTDPTSIAELTSESIAVWPNPTTNVLYLDVLDGTTVSVFDMTGRRVMQQRYKGQLDVSKLIPGLYTIKAGDFEVRFVKE